MCVSLWGLYYLIPSWVALIGWTQSSNKPNNHPNSQTTLTHHHTYLPRPLVSTPFPLLLRRLLLLLLHHQRRCLCLLLLLVVIGLTACMYLCFRVCGGGLSPKKECNPTRKIDHTTHTKPPTPKKYQRTHAPQPCQLLRRPLGPPIPINLPSPPPTKNNTHTQSHKTIYIYISTKKNINAHTYRSPASCSAAHFAANLSPRALKSATAARSSSLGCGCICVWGGICGGICRICLCGFDLSNMCVGVGDGVGHGLHLFVGRLGDDGVDRLHGGSFPTTVRTKNGQKPHWLHMPHN